jgi:ubiquinone/menaquinone biosynthesis C-methylase UbiE
VGTSSGAYIGALNVLATFSKVHFVLVDIDTNCLNKIKFDNMLMYYEQLKGSTFINSFNMVNNNADSLFLPLNHFKKLWIFNTLHEIDDKKNIVHQIAAVLRQGGEVVVAELTATDKFTIHKGCNKPLLTNDDVIKFFETAGFRFIEKANLQPLPKQKDKHPYMFYRFTKM